MRPAANDALPRCCIRVAAAHRCVSVPPAARFGQLVKDMAHSIEIDAIKTSRMSRDTKARLASGRRHIYIYTRIYIYIYTYMGAIFLFVG